MKMEKFPASVYSRSNCIEVESKVIPCGTDGADSGNSRRTSFGDVYSNLSPIDESGDVVECRPLKHKRKTRRPLLLIKDRPDVPQV
jgi:hypothetical protein